MANSLSDMAGSAARTSEFIDNIAKEHPSKKQSKCVFELKKLKVKLMWLTQN